MKRLDCIEFWLQCACWSMCMFFLTNRWNNCFVCHFDVICALFPRNHDSKIALCNNLESTIFKISQTAPTTVVPLKILWNSSPLRSIIATRALSLSLFIWKKKKTCPSFRIPPLPYKNPRCAPESFINRQSDRSFA